jgi:hypothetical protein
MAEARGQLCGRCVRGIAGELLVLGWLASRALAALPRFTDVSAEVLPFAALAVPPQINGGAAVGDCDGDGWPDLYFPAYAEHFLLANEGGARFVDRTENSGLREATANRLFAGRGAAWGDVDNDGDLDLFVTGYADARHFLFINDGRCHFTEEAAERGVAVDSLALGRSASFADYDRDGYLDLFVTEMQSDFVNPGVPRPVSHLFHNRGAKGPGFFDDVTVAAQVALDDVPGSQPGTFPFTPRFTDFDGDGWPDLAMASDFFQSRFFWNRGDGTFEDGTANARVDTIEYGMGAVTGDFDGDGWFDWFVTSIYIPGSRKGTGNRLYRYAGARRFEDVTDPAGVRDGGWGWGAEALDFDNDGDLDLAMTNGILSSEGDAYAEQEFGAVDLSWLVSDPARFWVNRGDGTFEDQASEVGFVDHGVGNALIAFDFDRDGDLDLLLVHDHSVLPVLYRNDGGNEQHWLIVNLRGTRSSRFGIGARVALRAAGKEQVREVSASSTLYGQNSGGWVHFGLAEAEAVDSLRVDWPSGIRQTLRDLVPNRYLTVVEPESCDGLPETDCSSDPVPTPTPPRLCAGDCDGDGTVTVAEIIRLVRVALALAALESCPAGDRDGNGAITIDEIVAAVRSALSGCT